MVVRVYIKKYKYIYIKKRCGGIFFCLTPGPTQRDFLSFAASEVGRGWLLGFVFL